MHAGWAAAASPSTVRRCADGSSGRGGRLRVLWTRARTCAGQRASPGASETFTHRPPRYAKAVRSSWRWGGRTGGLPQVGAFPPVRYHPHPSAAASGSGMRRGGMNHEINRKQYAIRSLPGPFLARLTIRKERRRRPDFGPIARKAALRHPRPGSLDGPIRALRRTGNGLAELAERPCSRNTSPGTRPAREDGAAPRSPVRLPRGFVEGASATSTDCRRGRPVNLLVRLARLHRMNTIG